MTPMICLATRQGNENSSITLKKKVLVKSEQCFAVTSAQSVAVFQASLKVVREDLGAQLSKRDNKGPHPKDQTVYEKDATVNKNDTLVSK